MTSKELDNIISNLPFLDRDELDRAHRELHRYLFGLQLPALLDMDDVVTAIDDLATAENHARRAWLQARINGSCPSLVHSLELEADEFCRQRQELLKEVAP